MAVYLWELFEWLSMCDRGGSQKIAAKKKPGKFRLSVA
jgi:hypothetical protein